MLKTTANSSTGALIGELRYKAWGEQRYTWGTTYTNRRYTGQLRESSLGGVEGMYYFNARWVDVYLNRWIQPDAIVPLANQGVQAWDRYAFVNNNPVRWNDPSGHMIPCGTLCIFLSQLYDNVMQDIGRTYVYDNNQADNVGELMVLAFFQEPSAEITGDALNDISSDVDSSHKCNFDG